MTARRSYRRRSRQLASPCNWFHCINDDGWSTATSGPGVWGLPAAQLGLQSLTRMQAAPLPLLRDQLQAISLLRALVELKCADSKPEWSTYTSMIAWSACAAVLLTGVSSSGNRLASVSKWECTETECRFAWWDKWFACWFAIWEHWFGQRTFRFGCLKNWFGIWLIWFAVGLHYPNHANHGTPIAVVC